MAAAGIGRTTFYDHFQIKNAAALSALEPLLVALGSAASGRAAPSHIEAMAAHCWERRALLRSLFDSTAARAIQRRLSDIVAGRLAAKGLHGPVPALQAEGIAAAQLAMLRSWVRGEVHCKAGEMAARLIECARIVPERAAERAAEG